MFYTACDPVYSFALCQVRARCSIRMSPHTSLPCKEPPGLRWQLATSSTRSSEGGAESLSRASSRRPRHSFIQDMGGGRGGRGGRGERGERGEVGRSYTEIAKHCLLEELVGKWYNFERIPKLGEEDG